MKVRHFLILAAGLSVFIPALHTQTEAAPRKEFRVMVAAAVQDIDGMDFTSGELEWQLERVEARRSATALIRATQDDIELRTAGVVWDLLQAKITCRIEAQAGSSLDGCYSRTGQLRSLALARAHLDPGRLYPHAQ